MTEQRIDTTRAADIGLVCGSSGSGKSWFVKDRIKDRSRIAIFDPDDEYADFDGMKTAQTCAELLQLMAEHESKPLRVRLVKQSKEAFNVFCKASFAWANATVICEEIAGRTSPSKAPDGWHTLISRGRKRGLSIIGVTQRPSESDKTIIGNASWLHVGRMSRNKDRDYMAAELDVNPAELSMTDQQFIHKEMITGKAIKGDMNNPTFKRNL